MYSITLGTSYVSFIYSYYIIHYPVATHRLLRQGSQICVPSVARPFRRAPRISCRNVFVCSGIRACPWRTSDACHPLGHKRFSRWNLRLFPKHGDGRQRLVCKPSGKSAGCRTPQRSAASEAARTCGRASCRRKGRSPAFEGNVFARKKTSDS
jgi:hypothetical protein